MSSQKTIVLINQYFYPDMAATSQLLGDLAEWLSERGWQVVALTGRARYAYGEGMKKNRAVRNWRGVCIRRVWCTDLGRGKLAARLCDYMTFLLSASALMVVSSRPDVVVCLSTPPFVSVLGLIARLKGSRLVYKVEDLYPDVAIALGSARARAVVTRVLLRLSRFLLRKADLVVALDDAMKKRLQSSGAGIVRTIPNWADGAMISPDLQAGQAFRKAHSLDGRFVVLYSGNLGIAHRFDAVAGAAKWCNEAFPNILFLFVGGGARLNELEEASRGLRNIRFMDYQPREKLKELYNAADIHLVTLRDEVAGLLFPSKYPAALAAGKPVLLVGGFGAPFEVEIRRYSLGWSCRHEASIVVDALRDAVGNPEKRKAMGLNARRLFESRYSKTIALNRWEDVLKSVLNREPIVEEGFPNAGKPERFDKEDRSAADAEVRWKSQA